MNPKAIEPVVGSIGSEFSSKSAEQFTETEIETLILNPPADRFL
jgi:hypothetical protein